MDFEQRSNSETGNAGISASSYPHVREVVKAASEEPPLPVIPAEVNREHATASLGKKEADEAVEPSDECTPQTPTLTLGKSARIALKSKGRILFIDAADLIAVEAKGNYVLLLQTSGSHMLRESISTIEGKLSLHGFVRIHRSVLVNAAFVEEIHSQSTGDYALRVRGGREFTVTRTYKKNLQLFAQLWIGIEGFASE